MFVMLVLEFKFGCNKGILSHHDTIIILSPFFSSGQDYVIPVSGYFCKLCHKFYNNIQAAKSTHCQSKAHFDKYKV